MTDEQTYTDPTVKNVLIGVTVGILLILFLRMFYVVPVGNVGFTNLFGVVSDQYVTSGFHIKNPLASWHKYSIRTQELKEETDVPSKEGLNVHLEVSILYRVQPDKANSIYKTIGDGYQEVTIVPMFRSSIREVTAKYEAKALYTMERDVVAKEIFEVLSVMMNERGIVVEKVLLRSIVLPDTVKTAIEAKLKAEQEAQQMEFTIQKEKLEAQRKIIEAGGIGEANRIISGSLTKNYLTWYWIQGLQTNEMQVVYVPIGDNGMPMFKDIDNVNTK